MNKFVLSAIAFFTLCFLSIILVILLGYYFFPAGTIVINIRDVMVCDGLDASGYPIPHVGPISSKNKTLSICGQVSDMLNVYRTFGKNYENDHNKITMVLDNTFGQEWYVLEKPAGFNSSFGIDWYMNNDNVSDQLIIKRQVNNLGYFISTIPSPQKGKYKIIIRKGKVIIYYLDIQVE